MFERNNVNNMWSQNIVCCFSFVIFPFRNCKAEWNAHEHQTKPNQTIYGGLLCVSLRGELRSQLWKRRCWLRDNRPKTNHFQYINKSNYYVSLHRDKSFSTTCWHIYYFVYGTLPHEHMVAEMLLYNIKWI